VMITFRAWATLNSSLEEGRRARRPGGAWRYLMACGLMGEPVPPVMTSGGPQKKNS